MSTKQKIILRRYRDGDSERKISRELKVNRETVRKYLQEYDPQQYFLELYTVRLKWYLFE